MRYSRNEKHRFSVETKRGHELQEKKCGQVPRPNMRQSAIDVNRFNVPFRQAINFIFLDKVGQE